MKLTFLRPLPAVCVLLALATAQAIADTHEELHQQYLAILEDGSATEARLREAQAYETQAFELSPRFKYAYNVGIAHATLEEYRESTSWLEKAAELASGADQQARTATALNYARTQLAKLETRDWGTSFSIRMVLKGGSLEMDQESLDRLPARLAPHIPGQPLVDIIAPVRDAIDETQFEIAEIPPFLIISQRGGRSAHEHYERGVVDFYRWYRLRYFDEAIPRPLVLLFVDDPYSGQQLISEIYPSVGEVRYQPFLGVYNPKDNLIVATVPSGYGTFLHELMHAMVRMDYEEVPPWLDEGMAMLYERSMWRADRLVPLPNWRLDGISDPSMLNLALFAAMDGRERLDYTDLSALRMLMLYLESKGRLKAFYEAVRQDPSLREPGAAVASLAIDPDDWQSFVKTSYSQYAVDKHRGGLRPTNPDEIKFVQQSLNRILGADLAVDGHWGPGTEQQVRNFQVKYGLEVDGLVGPATMKQLKLALAGR